MDWQGILIITLAVLLVLFTNKWWLPNLLNSLSGKRIKAKWGGKDYALTVEEAQDIIRKQQTAIQEPDYGIFNHLMRMPNVIGVELGPKIVSGQLTESLAFSVKVKKKLPLSELDPNDVIPATIGLIPTDVVEVSQ